MSNTQEIRALTGLRFVAAFYVFLFHMHIRWPITDMQFLKNILDQGAVGMSLFFILSGFVLAYRYADGATPLRAYLVNRFARIYPVYVASALLTLPWMGLSWADSSPLKVVKAVGQGCLLVLSNIFLIQAWFPEFFNYWNNGGSWSISMEAFCYVLLPLFLPTLVRLSPKHILFVALICYILAILSGFINVFFPSDRSFAYYSVPIYRLPEFVMGVCSYLGFRKGWGEASRKSSQAVFLTLTLIYLGFLGPKMPNYVGHNWIVVPFIAYTIITLAGGKGVFTSVLSHP